MIDADGALGHHFFKITKTERISHIPSHAQQHHIQRIMKPLQKLGNARSKGLSRCRGLLHCGPKQSVGNLNFIAASLLRQNPSGSGSTVQRGLPLPVRPQLQFVGGAPARSLSKLIDCAKEAPLMPLETNATTIITFIPLLSGSVPGRAKCPTLAPRLMKANVIIHSAKRKIGD